MSELQFLDSWTPEKAGRGWDQAVMGGILKVEAGEWCYQAVSIE